MPLLDYDKSSLDLALKEAQIMLIPFDKHFSLKNTEEGTLITFRDRQGNKHTARISKWHLKHSPPLDTHINNEDPELRALDVLRQAFGTNFFAEFDHALERFRKAQSSGSEEQLLVAARIKFKMSLVDLTLKSEIRHIASPLMHLAFRGRKYDIVNELWSLRDLPYCLINYFYNGFESDSKGCILASPESYGRDFWAVDQFDGNHTVPSEIDSDIASCIGTIIEKCLDSKLSPLREGIQNISSQTDRIPRMVTDYNEAINGSLAISAEASQKIHSILSLEQERVWAAVRATISYEKAAKHLKAQKIKMSASTVCRRMQIINRILKENDLGTSYGKEPKVRGKQSPAFTSESGNAGSKETYIPKKDDWARDRIERDSIITEYLKAQPEDKAYYHAEYFGIEDDAKEYLKNRK